MFLLQYLSANRMDISRVKRMVSLLWFVFFLAGVLAEGTLEKLHEGEYSLKFSAATFLISVNKYSPPLISSCIKRKMGPKEIK